MKTTMLDHVSQAKLGMIYNYNHKCITFKSLINNKLIHTLHNLKN